MVNLEWYRTFKAVYKTGTLTGAAEVLFISQPGVSLHLSSLESMHFHDIEKNADVPRDLGLYKTHLTKLFLN